MLVAAALAVAIAALTLAGASARRARRSRQALEVAEARLSRIDAATPAARDEAGLGASALRPDVRLTLEAQEREQDRALAARFLADYRDLAGAEEAIFWRWNADRDALAPDVWSSEGPRPAYFDVGQWAPLLQWSAETGAVQTTGHEEAVVVAAAAVRLGERLLGVLSLTHGSGIAMGRAVVREWVPRLAAQLAALHELAEVRGRHAGEMRRGQALLDAVQRLQGDRSGDGLARAACEAAMVLSGARAATLIRWEMEAETGEIHHATSGAGLATPAPLDPSSVVGEACRNGTVQVLEDARAAAAGSSLYGVARAVSTPGSVSIVPLAKDGRVLGALVLEADGVGALTLEDARHVTVLAAVVAGSLELAWSFAEVDRRARTDPLTGLYNRMHFGEQLQRTLAEADRFNQPLSLVVADVDHFKKVNDSWGHEAGDAVLKAVARIVQEGVRSVDVCVRYGGEEIAMLLAQTDSAHAVEVAERLRARIASTVVRHGGSEIAVTASFGVATYPETVKVRDQLFPSADKALYIAKQEGRNRVRAKPPTRGRATS